MRSPRTGLEARISEWLDESPELFELDWEDLQPLAAAGEEILSALLEEDWDPSTLTWPEDEPAPLRIVRRDRPRRVA